MKSLLCIAVVALFAWSAAKGVVDSNWTREFHDKQAILSVHVVDTLGVSADEGAVLVWGARDGNVVDTLLFGYRGVKGAWLAAQGNVIVVLLQDKTVRTWGTILWIDKASHSTIDSVGPLFSKSYDDAYAVRYAYGAASDSDSTLYIGFEFYLYGPYRQGLSSTYGFRIDLNQHVIEGTAPYVQNGFWPRFESHDTVITFVPQLGSSDEPTRSTSPSGKYEFGNSSLVNVWQGRGVLVRSLSKTWYVVRYGPTDATALAYYLKTSIDEFNKKHERYLLCVLDVFRDSVIQIVDSVEQGRYFTWCDPAGRVVYTFGNGRVRKSIVDTLAYLLGSSCYLAMPSTVFTDSLYFVNPQVATMTIESSLVFDKGDASPPTGNPYCSWQLPGTFECRVGIVHSFDTSWACRVPVTVMERKPMPPAARRFYIDRSLISSVDVSKPDTIIVSSYSGWVVAFDSSLKVLWYANRDPFGHIASTFWNESNEVECLMGSLRPYDFGGTHRDNMPLTLEVRTAVADAATSTFRVRDKLDCGVYVSTSSGDLEYSVLQVGRDRAGSVRTLSSIYSLFWCGDKQCLLTCGGFSSLKDGHFTGYVSDTSGRFIPGNYRRRCVTASMTEDRAHIVGHYVIYGLDGQAHSPHFTLHDVATDAVLDVIDGIDVKEIQCISSDQAVADSTWIDVSPFRVAEKHAFASPFAEDAVPGHAVAWKNGWFYSFSTNGRIHDSVQADTMRPTVIRVFKDGRIIAGYASGLVAIYGERKRDLTSVDQIGNEVATTFTCWPNPTSSTLHCQLGADMPLPATLEIFDMQGRLCGTTTLDSRDADVNLTTLMNMEATGLFVVRVRTDATLSFSKVVLVK